MAHYHGDAKLSPKRHYAYSNSPEVARLDKGRLKHFKGKSLCRKYVDKQGRRRYVGTARLRKSELGPQSFRPLIIKIVLRLHYP